ncbi:MAG TPA: protein kinase [Bryobacteraceae bacterium]
MTPQSTPAVPHAIAHYEILEKLGEGGMGVVYKARDTRLGRLVAIKFLAPRLADSPRARERFLREARIISTLNHPHVAVIHEVEESDGRIFLVFEHLPGGSLMTRPPRTLAHALEYALQLADALAAAHRHGVVHRDVKPSNILFTEDDTLKLADFGLARQTQDIHLTAVGMPMGTPAYMSPEQFQGAEADARSDVYSLGLVVYELVTGTLPQPGHTLAVPPQLQPILERALQTDPGRRYQNASEMAADLRGAAVQLESVTGAETVSLKIPPHRRAVWALPLLIVVSLLLVDHAPVRSGQVSSAEQLVVLPFANDGDPSWRVFCDGLTDTLSASLTRLENTNGSIRIAPADAVRRHSIATSSDARRMLGARLAITGTLRPETAGVRLTLRLVDTRDSRPLGVQTASFASDQLPFVQEWAVAGVARMLEIPGIREDSTALDAYRARQPGAYEFYLQGRGYLSHYDVPEDLANAVAAFHKALQRDPRYALAEAGMAEALWRTWRTTKDPQWLEQAAASAARARQLNDRLAPVHVILGRIESSRGRNQEALRAFRRALDFEPLNPGAHAGLGGVWTSMGNLGEAEAAYRKVIELRPREWPGYNDLAAFYTEQHRFPEAETVFQQMIALAPENVVGYQNLGGCYLMMARYTEAASVLERALALQPTGPAYSNLGTAYYYEGRYAEAAAAMEKAREQRPADYLLWGNLGDAYWFAPGQRGRAPQAWRSAVELARTQLRVNPSDPQVRSSLAVYEAHLGERAAALAEIARSRRNLPTNGRVLVKAARVYELCGLRQEALKALHAAMESGESPENLRREPEFAALRLDPACRQALPKEVCHESGIT